MVGLDPSLVEAEVGVMIMMILTTATATATSRQRFSTLLDHCVENWFITRNFNRWRIGCTAGMQKVDPSKCAHLSFAVFFAALLFLLVTFTLFYAFVFLHGLVGN